MISNAWDKPNEEVTGCRKPYSTGEAPTGVWTSAVDPKHYNKYAIQPVDFISENGLDFAHGCVIKYLMRHKDKGGATDLLKAKRFIDFILARDYGVVV